MSAEAPKKDAIPLEEKPVEVPGFKEGLELEKKRGEALGLKNLKEILEQLGTITHSLRRLGSFVVICAGCALAGVMVGIVTKNTLREKDGGYLGGVLLLMALGMAAQGIMTLFLWDQRKRRGSLYYEEISDELEWRHRGTRYNQIILQDINSGAIHIGGNAVGNEPKKGTPQTESSNGTEKKPRKRRKRPDLAIRLQLREFLDATTLPFAGANMSSTIYLMWFLSCIFAALFGISLPYKGF